MKLKAFFQWRSLKTRVTLFTLAIFMSGIWSLSIYADHMLHRETESVLGNQQLSIVSLLAEEMDHELADRLQSLEAIAMGIAPDLIDNPAALQASIERLPLLHGLFNGGVLALRSDGTAIVEAPRTAERIGVNYMDIDTIAAALKEGKSTIGRPVMGKKLQAPVFGMAVPIRDADGRVIGALSGVINLGLPSFLDRVTQSTYGKTGGYVLLIPRDRLIVTATDQQLIMQSLPARGVNPMLDRFLDGYRGSAIYTNPFGAEVLGSVSPMPVSGWLLAATLPTAEAFAALTTLRRHMLVATLFLTLLAGGLTWWLLRRELSPLLATADKLAAMSDEGQPLLPLPGAGQGEVAQLIRGFNRLLASLAARKATLHESEARYRSFFELSPDAIFVHRDNLVVFANDCAARLFRADSAAALLGRDWHELITPDDWPATEQRVAALYSGDISHLPPLERRHLTLDGRVVVTESTGSRIIFDGRPAVLSVLRDITARRQAEEQRMADARQQRDTLVREVHHRIKNNLQSVAGLLQRELGQFIELDPRLETAISQVRAIALVHGLQSGNPDEAVRLCDSVENICKTVAELSQRPVRFDIEDGQSGFRPVRVANDEAVSVALVLNELILNAVKHSPRGGAAPTVSLNADGASAQLLIRNALATTPEFDIDSGAGLGTGLSLVRSLLPARGAHLSYELDKENFMLTRLNLTAPVVSRTPGKEPG